MTITHDALDLTIQGSPLYPPRLTPKPPNPPTPTLDMGHRCTMTPLPSLTPSDMFKLVQLGPYCTGPWSLSPPLPPEMFKLVHYYEPHTGDKRAYSHPTGMLSCSYLNIVS